jgi:hypothetical protein
MEKLNREIQEDLSSRPGLYKDSTESELELLEEIVQALRAIRYGSVTVTVHDGRIVEVQKTERIRKSPAKRS